MAQSEPPKPTCFVMMPISDVNGYEVGHFGRVYEFIIKPACSQAGFRSIRADEVQITNYIVIDILRKILEADMVVCDLSSRNSNVLYELGICQAFNRPVTLIRDSRTPRIFDVQGLRDLEYDESLRIDKINLAVESLTNLLRNTSNLDSHDVNSIVQLLGLKPAQVPSVELSTDTSLILNAITDIRNRLLRLEEATLNPTHEVASATINLPAVRKLKNGTLVTPGFVVWHPEFGDGVIDEMDPNGILVSFDNFGAMSFMFQSDDIEKLRDHSPTYDPPMSAPRIKV